MEETKAPVAGGQAVNAELTAAAAAQMRRPPPGHVPKSKRQKQGEDAEVDAPTIGRFAYDAPQRLTQGCQAVMITCNMRHEKTAAKEALGLLQHYLPLAAADMAAAPAAAASAPEAAAAAAAGAEPAAAAAAIPPYEYRIAKVGVQGVVVAMICEPAVGSAPGATGAEAGAVADACAPQGTAIAADQEAGAPNKAAAADAAQQPDASAASYGPCIPPFLLTAAVNKMLADVEMGKRKKTEVAQRIYPFERTCAFEADALRAHIQTLARDFKQSILGKEFEARQGGGEPIRFAAAFKNRNSGPTVPTWNGKDLFGTDSHPYTLDKPTADKPQPPATAGPAPASAAGAGSDAPGGFAAAAAKAEGGKAVTDESGKAEAKKEANAAQALRSMVLNVLATSFNAAMQPWTVKVDLTSPELVLFCEVIPAAGQTFAGLALVPGSMAKAKPNIYLKSCHA